MITVANRAQPESDEPDSLKKSEKEASQSQPGSFKEEALTEKIVRIPPFGTEHAPIKGLDPEPAK